MRLPPFIWVLAAALLFYGATFSHTVFWGDAAQFAERAASLELLPQARAYPLFRLLSWLFGKVAGSPATGANLVSAVFSAITVALTFELARRVTSGIAAAIAAAGAVALAHTFWTYALIAEVYGMHTAFLVGALLLALPRPGESGRRVFWLGVLLSLSQLHHRLMLFTAPVIVVWAIAVMPSGTRWRSVRRLAAGLLVGAVPFAVLVAVDLKRMLAEGGDAGRWAMGVLSGGGYQFDRVLEAPGKPLLASVRYVLKWVAFNLPGPALILAAIGFLVRGRMGRKLAVLLVLVVLTAAIFPLRYNTVGDQYAFLTPLYPVLAVAAALGLSAIGERFGRRAAGVACALVILAPLLLYSGLAAAGPGKGRFEQWTPAAVREFFLPPYFQEPPAPEWCRQRLERLPEGALLFADWGSGRVFHYLGAVEGVRPDVEVRTWLPRRPSMHAGHPEFWIAILPVWEDPRSRLGAYADGAKEVEPGLFLIRR